MNLEASLDVVASSLKWAIETARAPALMLVVHDGGLFKERAFDACLLASGQSAPFRPQTKSWVHDLIAGGASLDHEVEVVDGGLSLVPPEARDQLNLLRERILEHKRKIVFVEPAREERRLRADYQHLLAVSRDTFRFTAPCYRDDHGWDSQGAGGPPIVARRMPRVVTHGSTMIIEGRVDYKGPWRVPCPNCKQLLEPGIATLTFHLAPEKSRNQEVNGWVCQCGESYVPGSVAREAHSRAFARNP